VLDAAASHLVLDVLADPQARVASFGERSVLELPFPFAAKTGTSKGFRDNIAVGATPTHTIAVWVGNMDGSPMRGVSGVTGAGPLLHAIALATMRGAGEASPPFPRPEGIEEVEVCAASGRRAGPSCPRVRRELALRGHAPRETCEVHATVAVDRRGDLASPTCEGAVERRVEVWPPPFDRWAAATGRPSAPRGVSTACPPDRATLARLARADAPRIVFPSDGDRFHLDPGAAAPAAIEIVVDGAATTLELDGRPLRLSGGRATWELVPGDHRLVALGHPAPARHAITFHVE
jgi:penicillin-binding protein 1C